LAIPAGIEPATAP